MPVIDFRGDELKELGDLTLIEFYTDWCPSCRAAKNAVERLVKENEELEVLTVNTDENPKLAKEFGIMSVPTFVLMKEGRVHKRVSGAKSLGELRELTLI